MPRPAPQGIFLHPLIADYETVAFPFSGHGTQPSAITVVTSPSGILGLSTSPQDCQFSYLGTVARFPDCIIDTSSVDYHEGGQRMVVRILDHRWRWQNTARAYTLAANRRVPGSTKNIIRGSRIGAREIGTRLLRAANENRFDIRLLPEADYPEIEIDGTVPPMIELEQLADLYGLRICYSPQDRRVAIVRPGQGNPMPPDPAFPAISINPPEVPDEILIVGDEVRFQARWVLEAVGKEKDGSYRPLDKLSYKPSQGWDFVWPASIASRINSTDEDTIKAAEESVWRSYRIQRTKDTPRGGGRASSIAKFLEQFRDHEDETIRVTKLDQVLPVENSVLERDFHPDGSESAKPAALYGKWAHERPDTRERRQTNRDEDFYPGSWSMETDTGVVTMSEPTFLIDDGKIKPAELELECCFPVRTASDQIPLRASWKYRVGNRGAGLRVYSRPQLTREVEQDKRGRVMDGLEDMRETGERLTREILQSFAIERGENALYNRLVIPQPDGALLQYQIRVGVRGCTTQVSRNVETSPYVDSYDERARRSRELAEKKQVRALRRERRERGKR